MRDLLESIQQRSQRLLRELAAGAGGNDRGVAIRAFAELPNEPGLADSGLPADQHEAAMPFGGLAPALHEMLEFVGTADKRPADDACRDHRWINRGLFHRAPHRVILNRGAQRVSS